MKKFFIVTLIGLVMAVGMVLAGCDLEKEGCKGTGECTVTVKQGTSGLYVDYDSPRSSCGKSSTWNSSYNDYRGGCRVQDVMDGRNRRYGTHSCDC